MLKQIARKVVIGAVLAGMVTPAAFAGGDPTGTDPEPGGNAIVHVIMVMLGLA